MPKTQRGLRKSYRRNTRRSQRGGTRITLDNLLANPEKAEKIISDEKRRRKDDAPDEGEDISHLEGTIHSLLEKAKLDLTTVTNAEDSYAAMQGQTHQALLRRLLPTATSQNNRYSRAGLKKRELASFLLKQKENREKTGVGDIAQMRAHQNKRDQEMDSYIKQASQMIQFAQSLLAQGKIAEGIHHYEDGVNQVVGQGQSALQAQRHIALNSEKYPGYNEMFIQNAHYLNQIKAQYPQHAKMVADQKAYVAALADKLPSAVAMKSKADLEHEFKKPGGRYLGEKPVAYRDTDGTTKRTFVADSKRHLLADDPHIGTIMKNKKERDDEAKFQTRMTAMQKRLSNLRKGGKNRTKRKKKGKRRNRTRTYA